MLLDRGALVQEGAIYRPTGTIESLEVPETLHALIAARLDGLSVEERRMLQDGSVIGKTFTKQALATLSGLAESELEPILNSLTRKEVLGVQADPRSPEHGQYGFLQDLLRRVAYETLSRTDRKAKHLAAAAYLESLWGEHEVVEVVASHYLDAYQAAPDAPDAPAIRTKAGEQLARAGERAASLGASEEGERYFAQAAELAGDATRKAELEEQSGRMAWLGARTGRARELLDEAHAVFAGAEMMKEAARVSAVLAGIDYAEGHPPQAITRLQTALEALEAEEPNDVVASVAAELGRFLILDNQSDRAAPHLERALKLAEALRLPEVFAQALTSKAILFINQDRLKEARILLEGALESALESDLHAPAIRAINNLAVVYESSDRYADALELSDRGLELARRAGNRPWEMIFTSGPLSALILLGRWDEAVVRAADVKAAELTDVAAQLAFLATAYCERGDRESARQLLEAPALRDSEGTLPRMGLAVHESAVLRSEGRAQAALEKANMALELWPREELSTTYLHVKLALVEALEASFSAGDETKMRELLDEIDVLRPGEHPPLLEAHAHRFHAKLAGDEDRFLAAESLFRELSLTFWFAVTLLEHAELLAKQGREDEAELLLAEAREIFERLEARPWLARLDAAQAGMHTQIPA
jgi:tetratricopeptide (TPR) repeat protein